MNTVLLTLSICALIPMILLLLYPLWGWVMAAVNQKTVIKSAGIAPPVSIIVACYNEEQWIGEKIESLLSPANWIPGSELIVVSGGSTDRTNEILRTFQNRDGVRIVLFEQRTSKINGVNHAVKMSQHELFVFSDCRQRIKEGSIHALIQNFSDPEVGTVSASLNDSKTDGNSSFFRSMFDFMAANDSLHSSCLNVYGALYAQRKSVYRKIPSNLLFDDLFVVVSTLSQRKRVVQEKAAVIYDVHFERYYEKERIRRLVRGLLIFLFNQPSLIFSLPVGTLIRFLIYKYLKLLMPYFLLILIVCATLFAIHHEIVMLLFGMAVATSILFVRHQFLLFVRINYHIFVASLAYLFGLQRSNDWEKLKTDQSV